MAKKEETKKEPIYFSTGDTILDIVTGGGEKIGFGMGYSAGTIVRDWGDSSSSKSFKACEMIAANYYKYKDKFKWAYADVEHGNTIDTVALYGFDMFAGAWKSPKEVRTVEAWEYDVTKFIESLKSDECGIYILDSLDMLSCDAIEDRKEERRNAYDKGKEFDAGTYGMNSAKFLSQEMFRGLSAELEKHNAMLYVISQARDNVGNTGYGPKNRVGGGRALQFAETVRIQSKMLAKEEIEGRAYSVQVGITAEKTRHPRPFRSCQFPIVFSYGLDKIGSEIDFLYDLRSDKTGELLGRANAVAWGSDKEVTDDTISEFLDKHGVLEECLGELKKKFNIKNIKKWIEERPVLLVEFEEEFGKTMTRDELIKYIEENKLKKELKRRVIEKWEAIEERVACKRPNKYSDLEEDE